MIAPPSRSPMFEKRILNSLCLSRKCSRDEQRDDGGDRYHQHHFLPVAQARQCLASAIQRIVGACWSRGSRFRLPPCCDQAGVVMRSRRQIEPAAWQSRQKAKNAS
jgi:hypothetical protein